MPQSQDNYTAVLSKASKKDAGDLVMGPGKGTRQGTTVVYAGTPDRLIGRLIGESETDPSLLDSEYLQIFLLTYRTFSTPLELIDRIHRR